MPYSSVGELPENVKGLPAKAQEIWMEAFNSGFEQCQADGLKKGNKTCDQQAARIAWAAVKNYGKGG